MVTTDAWPASTERPAVRSPCHSHTHGERAECRNLKLKAYAKLAKQDPNSADFTKRCRIFNCEKCGFPSATCTFNRVHHLPGTRHHVKKEDLADLIKKFKLKELKKQTKPRGPQK
eukprot:SAG31_NODE_668_length_12945_cov_15.915849_5_plen_115_part_00